jgi:hypothetical protein
MWWRFLFVILNVSYCNIWNYLAIGINEDFFICSAWRNGRDAVDLCVCVFFVCVCVCVLCVCFVCVFCVCVLCVCFVCVFCVCVCLCVSIF